MILFGKYTNPTAQVINCYKDVDLRFGNFCSIGSPLTIISGQHPIVEYPECVSQYSFKEEFGWDYPASKMDGTVMVGNDVWIGQNVTILEGVTIGDGAVIGACSVVAKDVPPYAVVVGNPAVVKKYRFDPTTISRLLAIQWWHWDTEKIERAMSYMRNIDDFLKKYD